MATSSTDPARELLAKHYGDEVELLADPHVQTTGAGREIIYFHQSHRGLPVFGSRVAVHLEAKRISGKVQEHPAGDPLPATSPSEAVAAAAAHFLPNRARSGCQAKHRSLRTKPPTPVVTASFPLPARPSIVTLGRGAPALAHLEWFEQQLAWVVRLPFRSDTYLLAVAANGAAANDVLFCTPWSAGARCTGRIFGFDDVRDLYTFPAPHTMYPAPLVKPPRSNLLADWIEADGTAGNNVVTHFGNPERLVRAAGGVFRDPLDTRDQALPNAFFFCNYLHDFFLLLGFGEKEGNFQATNAPGQPGGGDRLRVKVFSSVFDNLGKMSARVDGEPAELKLGIAPNKEQVALHSDVVIHEYTHGVSQRMVGGRGGAASLVFRQSLALSEGWSDYFAITLRNHHLPADRQKFTFADWAGPKSPARTAPYDQNYDADYGAVGRKGHNNAHGAGEIMAIALIRFNELLVRALGRDNGNCLGWRVVVESFRQCNPANPTLLDGRTAVFDAIDELETAANELSTAEAEEARNAARAAFARTGMGPAASGPPSGELGPTTPDFEE